MSIKQPVWPAVIMYHGDDELTFVNNESQWLAEAHPATSLYTEGDQLVDSEGQCFTLAQAEGFNNGVPQRCTGLIATEAFLEKLKAHISSLGNCCVAKAHISSVAEGVAIVGQS